MSLNLSNIKLYLLVRNKYHIISSHFLISQLCGLKILTVGIEYISNTNVFAVRS